MVVNLDKVAESEKNEVIESIANAIKDGKSLIEVRKMYLAKKDSINDYVEAGSALYNYVIDNGLVVDLDGILKMTDILFYMNTVIDKESNFFGLVTAVAKWISK